MAEQQASGSKGPFRPWDWEILRKMSNARDNGQVFCDCVLLTEAGERFVVHRIALASRSRYFRRLFKSTDGHPSETEFDSIGSPMYVYTISGVSAAILGEMIEFMYKQRLNLSREDIATLLPMLGRFEVAGLTNKCYSSLMEMMTVDNAVGILKIVISHKEADEIQEAKLFIARRITDVVTKSSEFFDLTVDEFELILGNDELNTQNEEFVFNAVVRWMEHDYAQRAQHFPRLLCQIRFALMDRRFVDENVVTHDYVKNNEDECLPVVLRLRDETSARPRVPYTILIAIGGWSGGSPTNIFETYDHKAEKWIFGIYGDIYPRAYHGMVVLDGCLYLVGGFSGNRHYNTLRCFDLVTKVWAERSPMHHRRCYVSVCVLDGMIYAMGGFNGTERMKSVERYDRQANQWTEIRPMNKFRSDASSAAFNGKVYIVGGFSGETVLRSAEVYDPKTDTWTLLRDMHTPRSGVSLTVYENRLYAIGGFDGVHRLSSVERYSPLFDQWTEIAPMLTPRSNFASEVLNNRIYVIGGFDGMSTTSFVESYDTESDSWTARESMTIDRSALRCCVVEGLPTTKDFLRAAGEEVVD